MKTFANPTILLLLLLLPLLAVAPAILARLLGKRWVAFVAPRLRKRLLEHDSPYLRWISFACLLAALALLVITLARPQNLMGTRSQEVVGRNILIALDLSRSMKATDITPDRLSQAKTLCYEILEALPNDRIGLVGFAGTSHLFAPLTVDHAAVRETISQIDIDWIPTGGSNLAGGVERSIDVLRKTGTSKNALILLSDGEEHMGNLSSLAATAKAAGIKVIAIGFGTPAGGSIPHPQSPDGYFHDRSGKRVVSRLETQALEAIAGETNGRFALATSGSDIPGLVATTVSDLDETELGQRQITIAEELYAAPLLAALLLLMAATMAGSRWRNTALALISFFFIFPTTAHANTLSDAKRAMANQNYEDAGKAYGELAEKEVMESRALRFRLAQGTAAYRAGDFSTARQAFSEALRSKNKQVRSAAHQGLGNTLFEMGWGKLSDGLRYPNTPAAEEPKRDADAFDRLSDALIEPPDQDKIGDMVEFERLVKQRLGEWLQEKHQPGELSEGSKRFHLLFTDWIDAIKHYDDVDSADAEHNAALTYSYLEKIKEILKQIEENAQQIEQMPMEGGSDDSQDPQNQGDDEGEQGDKSDQQDRDRGDQDQDAGNEEDQQDKGQGDQEEDEKESGEDEQNQDEKSEEDAQENEEKSHEPDPDESPEEMARRILEENSDLQKGALSPGKKYFHRPEKDW